MKSKIWFVAIALFSLSRLFAESNTTANVAPLTVEDIEALSGIFEPSAELIGTQVEFFGIIITVIIALISFLGYMAVFKPMMEVGKSTTERLQKQYDQAEKKLEKELARSEQKLEKEIARIEKIIEREVQSQIVYGLNGKIDKALEYAEERIEEELRKVKEKAMERLFDYQELVYEVNQNIKHESDEILARKDLDQASKLAEIIAIQYHYNEISNHDLPRLFSDNITEVIQTAKQLSEYERIRPVIRLHLYDLLHKNSWSNMEKEELQKVIEQYYNTKDS